MKKRSRAFSNAQKRNWAKFRINGVLTTCKNLSNEDVMYPHEKRMLYNIIVELKKILRSWTPTI